MVLRLQGWDSPFATRLYKAAIAVVLILLTASVGAQHFGGRAGWCAAGVLVSSIALPLAVRSGDGTQLLGTLLAWIGCGGFADALFGRPSGRALRLVVAYASLAAAMLVAGPLSALWPVLGLALYLALARTPDGWGRSLSWLGLAVVIVVVLPWYAAMGRQDPGFLARAWAFPYAAETRGTWYAGFVLPFAYLAVGAFPWSALLPSAALHAATWWRFARRRRAAEAAAGLEQRASDPIAREQREETAAHYFIAALLAAMLPIAVYPGPPLPAILPALPAIALLCGRMLDHLFEDPRRLNDSLGYAARMLWVLGSVALILMVLLSPRIPEASHALRLLGSAVFLVSWGPFLARLIGRPRVAALLFATPVVVGTPIVTLRLLPAMEDYLNTRSVAVAFDRASPPHAPVLADPPPPSLRLYSGRPLLVRDLGADAPDTYASDGRRYFAFRPGRESEAARRIGRPLQILLRTPTLVLARGGRRAEVATPLPPCLPGPREYHAPLIVVPRRNTPVIRKIVLVLFVLVVLAFGAAAAYVASRQNLKFEAPYPPFTASTDSAVVERGRYVVRDVVGCASRHGDPTQRAALAEGADVPLSGGFVWDIPPGKIYSANITSDPATGIGAIPDAYRTLAPPRRRARRPRASPCRSRAVPTRTRSP